MFAPSQGYDSGRVEMHAPPDVQRMLEVAGEDVVLASDAYVSWCGGAAEELLNVEHMLASPAALERMRETHAALSGLALFGLIFPVAQPPVDDSLGKPAACADFPLVTSDARDFYGHCVWQAARDPQTSFQDFVARARSEAGMSGFPSYGMHGMSGMHPGGQKWQVFVEKSLLEEQLPLLKRRR